MGDLDRQLGYGHTWHADNASGRSLAETGRRRQGRRSARGASRPKRPEAREAQVAIYIAKSLFFEKTVQ